MVQRFVIRLMSDQDELLSWAEVMAEARPQGRPRSTPFMALGPTPLVIEKSGLAASIIVHWPDLDLVRRTPLMNPTPVDVGLCFRFDWIEPVWMVKGADADIPLPQVTVRKNVAIAPSAGSLSALASR